MGSNQQPSDLKHSTLTTVLPRNTEYMEAKIYDIVMYFDEIMFIPTHIKINQLIQNFK